MKRTLYIIIPAFAALAVASCNDFLDENPDKRAELDSTEKIAQILISAYPTELSTLMFEFMSDNVEDNGPDYGSWYLEPEQAYYFKEFTDVSWDVPTRVWESCYGSIASANMALDAIQKMDDPSSADGIKAEALLCRAFSHFMLANTFCIAWNPVSSETDMGIPYMETVETTVASEYDRGTVAQVYEKIDRDIEEALPLLSEDHLAQPKYHFNLRAAYAFAARFNLYYGRWDKVVEYATNAIGEDPSQILRQWSKYKSFTSLDDWLYSYISTDDPANLLIMTQRSRYGRIFNIPNRYGHNRERAYFTIWQYFPWKYTVNNFDGGWGNAQVIRVPKVREIFETTNPTANTGQPHIVLTMFTSDETLACRAEAYIMLKEYDLAARDLNYWYLNNGPAGSAYTADEIASYYSKGNSNLERVVMESRFGVESGLQENMLQAVLALRRFEGVFEGTRFPDIKRHGITVRHPVKITNNQPDTLILRPYEPRTAIQLPADVIYAGLPANPR